MFMDLFIFKKKLIKRLVILADLSKMQSDSSKMFDIEFIKKTNDLLGLDELYYSSIGLFRAQIDSGNKNIYQY